MLQILASIDTSATYTCGDIGLKFSGMLPYVVSMAITIIKIVVPILLIIFGMMDLGKAVMAQKEDEIKKGQQTFIKRLIAAAIVFFVIAIVKFLVSILAGAGANTYADCIECFTRANESCVSQ